MVKTTGPIVAYDAKHLAEGIRRYVGIIERNLGTVERLDEEIRPLLDKAKDHLSDPNATALTAFENLKDVTIVYDRMAKGNMSMVKALDELSRLQSFLSGGPDSRPDLSSMSENQLRSVVLEAMRALGVTTIQQLEAAAAPVGA